MSSRFRNAKLSPYNQNTAAFPNSYGAFAKLYVQLMYGANKKIEPLTSDAMIWGMEANGSYGEPWPPSAPLSAPTSRSRRSSSRDTGRNSTKPPASQTIRC